MAVGRAEKYIVVVDVVNGENFTYVVAVVPLYRARARALYSRRRTEVVVFCVVYKHRQNYFTPE